MDGSTLLASLTVFMAVRSSAMLPIFEQIDFSQIWSTVSSDKLSYQRPVHIPLGHEHR